MSQHHPYLQLALAQAQRRRGHCAPNPAVGAVVVKDDRVLAAGHHWASGHPHAEVEALKDLGPRAAAGATLYVTLEPCAHQGKTPPCTRLLIARGIKKVIYGYRDPNPVVSGRGEATLSEAGIACLHQPWPQCDAFYQSYTHWQHTKRPWVTAKLALSLDGKIAARGGASVAITGAACQRYTHRCRKQSDALLTTAKTIRQDNPRLNVRLDNETVGKPVYILDSRLAIDAASRILQSAQSVTLLHSEGADPQRRRALENAGAKCVSIAETADGLCLNSVLATIGEAGVHDLWIEAGGRCFESFLSRGLLHRALIYVSPQCLGEDAQSAFGQPVSLFAKAREITWDRLGQDAVCEMVF